MKIYIDSGTHIDCGINERINGIGDAVEPDVVFIEGSGAELSTDFGKELLQILLYAPLLLLTMLFFVYVVVELGGRLLAGLFQLIPGFPDVGRDGKVIDEIHQRYDAEKEHVDKNKLDLIYEDRWVWFVMNWAFIFLVLYGTRVAIPPTPMAILVLSSMLSLSGVAIFALFLQTVNNSRNDHIINKIAETATSYDEGCLVIGVAHHDEVGTELDSFEHIDVMNPTADDQKLLTRIRLGLI